jgi:acyl-CoA thioester hydrolase
MVEDDYADSYHYVWENQVRFAETDAQSVVFYGEYVTYQDETFSQYLREIDYDYHQLEDAGWDIHVVHVDVDYRAPAEFDDWLVNGIRVDRIGESAIDFSWICRHRDSGETVAEGGLTHVAVDESGEPRRVPDAFREAVADFQDEPPESA